MTLTDGRRLRSGDVEARGGPGLWMTDAELEDKFHAFCGVALDRERTAAIWSMRDELLEPGVKFRELAKLVQPKGNRA